MPKIKSRGFTLIELILVVSMIIILAVIGTNSYIRPRNRALSREAIATLRLIAAAERIYKMENTNDTYIACSNAGTTCNDALRLYMNATNWTHEVRDVAGSGTAATANIIATSTATTGCTYTYPLDSTNLDPDPTVSGCPAGMN